MDEFSKDEYKKYFRLEEDKSITFIGEKLIIQVPQFLIDQGVVEIVGTDVISLGIFDGYIFDDIEENDINKAIARYTSKIPSVMSLKPSHIEEGFTFVENPETETLVKEKTYSFIFLKGDTYVESISLVKESDTADKWLVLMLHGKIPTNVKYSEIPVIWSKCAFLNGLDDLGSEFNTLSAITANLVRDPKNYSNPFRYVFDKYFDKGIYNGKMLHYYNVPMYVSNFTSITGANAKHGITVAMTRNTDIKTPVEDMIN